MSGSRALPRVSRSKLAAVIDHTCLDPLADAHRIDRACEEALTHGFAAVCIHPVWVERVRRRLEGGAARTCAVVGFPSGASRTEIKLEEARRAIADGARELDVVVALWALASGDLATVGRELESLVAVARGAAIVKAILETAALTDEQKRAAARTAVAAGADFVKTSTGFGPGGATVEDVRLLRDVVGPDRGVKASGGIRTAAQALALLEAGASRLGTSAGIAVLEGLAAPRS